MQSSIIKDEYIQMQISHISEICKRIKPLVVIRSITYNHEQFLRDAIESFVTQQTNFPFVAVIHDDASTDGTASILKEYAEKYPDIILPIYETENQHSKHDGSLDNIMFNAVNATEAKYIAYCEGDDYWTDPNKLQKQVDFLESHPDYSMCFHSAIVHHENSDKKDHPFSILETREYFEEELSSRWLGATASFLFRKSVYSSTWHKEVAKSDKFIVGDYPLLLSCIRNGRIYAFSDCMSVYRINNGGWTQRRHPAYKFIMMDKEVIRIFGGISGNSAKKNAVKESRESVSLFFNGQFNEARKVFSEAFQLAPLETIVANIKFFIKIIRRKLTGR